MHTIINIETILQILNVMVSLRRPTQSYIKQYNICYLTHCNHCRYMNQWLVLTLLDLNLSLEGGVKSYMLKKIVPKSSNQFNPTCKLSKKISTLLTVHSTIQTKFCRLFSQILNYPYVPSHRIVLYVGIVEQQCAQMKTTRPLGALMLLLFIILCIRLPLTIET